MLNGDSNEHGVTYTDTSAQFAVDAQSVIKRSIPISRYEQRAPTAGFQLFKV
jgi:hypothetical protein